MTLKTTLLASILLLISLSANAQTKLNLGGGYFGENITYPGMIAEFEYEKFHTGKFSTPLKIDIGFYNHPRSHSALLIDLHEGFRMYTKNQRWYFEQSIGLGAMLSFYNEDIWHVDETGNVARVSSFANVDFMPSVTFGCGFNLTPNNETAHFIWIRPKLFWQLPYNNLATVHTALMIGYSYNLKTK